MKKKYIGALDQGTTSTRFLLFNRKGEAVSSHQLEHEQIYPQPGWVEHDPMAIWERAKQVIRGAFEKKGIPPSELEAMGITNQRETSVVWDRDTGKPYYNAIVWQDTRTRDICDGLSAEGGIDRFRKTTGLPISTYFSAPKLAWLFGNIPGLREASENGRACFGTIDTWLIWWLTGGPNGGRHVTDVTNASRTLLFNLESLGWDQDLLAVFDVPRPILPEVRPSIEPATFGTTTVEGFFPGPVPITGILGDQQAALFGQACFEPGESKNTYGTGCFMLTNTGERPVVSRHGLITTVAYKAGKQPARYALEGSVAIAGSLVQWFRDNLGLIGSSGEINDLASQVPDNGGIYFVPAFSGLFAPYWKADARGVIAGMTHSTNKGHLARAVLEATAFQTREIFDAMKLDSGRQIPSLKVDGGMVASELLMQFQADILGIPIIAPSTSETTALGACYAAGLGTGFWSGIEELKKNWTFRKKWEGEMSEEKKERIFRFWKKAVGRTFDWLEPGKEIS
ncbi:MAG TPA: glycerol kinase GlpK [Spirochaetia bacterium]|nr:glycerol kinase GlpK [Spirochaetia bacterium]